MEQFYRKYEMTKQKFIILNRLIDQLFKTYHVTPTDCISKTYQRKFTYKIEGGVHLIVSQEATP